MNTKTNFLLPHKFQIAGWWGLLASAAIFAILLCTKIYVPQLYTPPILLVTIPFLISLLLICISCEKIDDEYINALRSRIIYYIIIAVVLIKMFYYISVVICTSYGAICTLGIISFINIQTYTNDNTCHSNSGGLMQILSIIQHLQDKIQCQILK